MHDLTRVLLHKNVLAPIEDRPRTQIIDLGTGSGIAFEDKAKEKGNGRLKLQTNSLMHW